ncbi:MAG: Do family serine endopeptidase [Bacteroidetes bacterium]|nr:MAG: Do family serine endopeptidase [Bacteroidota bacterium]
MLGSAIFGGTITLAGYKLFFDQPSVNFLQGNENARFSSFFDSNKSDFIVPQGMNFVLAAQRVTPAVVHIKTFSEGGMVSSDKNMDEIWDWFKDRYGDNDNKDRAGSGSGVIISEDGYIITNNHVIENSDKIEVILDDKRKFKALVVGTDPTTDLALIKVEAQDLIAIEYGNSDEIKIGEWVLAIGNPFDLNSTVTAGIISAKSRNINILRNKENLTIESFIQTDAAVNPGNSGGALVNLKGELIGINTAIATSTGGYAGYSFAVPVTLVKKVAEDLLKFGQVQRALLGVSIQDISAELAEELKLEITNGVYVAGINSNSAAAQAGMKVGDIITEVNATKVGTVSALQEMIARYRPGDKVEITYLRKGQEFKTNMVLRNKDNNTQVVKINKVERITDLGVDVLPLTNEEKLELDLKSGIKIVKVFEGKLKAAKVKEGFIITAIDKIKVNSAQDIEQVLKNKSGGVLIEGIDINGEKSFYGIGF